jgi:hypothetical protein
MSNKIYLFNCVFFVCVLLCFILSIILFAKVESSDFHFITSIGENWNQGPIYNIEKGNYFDCPKEKVSIIDYVWEGTKNGCYCQDDKSTLFSNTCSKKEEIGISTKNCYSVPKIEPIIIKIWKGTNICGKRGNIYPDLNIVEYNQECGDNKKSCGIIDNLNNKLCIHKNNECPYNEVKFFPQIKKQTKANIIIPLGENGNDGNLIFSNNENINGKIITEFRIEDDTPCIDKRYKNLNYTPYKLDLNKNNIKCRNFIGRVNIDKTFQKIDSVNYSRLYKENGLYDSMIKLPLFENYFKKFSEKKTSLYYKNYMGIKPICMKKLKQNRSNEMIIFDLINIEMTMESIIIHCLCALILGITGVLLFLLFGMVYFCDKGNLNSSFINILTICLFCFPYIFISSFIFNKLNYIGLDFNILSDKNCTDPITSFEVSRLNLNFSFIKNISLLFFCNSIVAVFANSFSLIFMVTYKSII